MGRNRKNSRADAEISTTSPIPDEYLASEVSKSNRLTAKAADSAAVRTIGPNVRIREKGTIGTTLVLMMGTSAAPLYPAPAAICIITRPVNQAAAVPMM